MNPDHAGFFSFIGGFAVGVQVELVGIGLSHSLFTVPCASSSCRHHDKNSNLMPT